MKTVERDLLPFSAESCARLGASRREGPAPAELRRRAWNAYENFPMPSTEDEAWRRTDISFLDLERFRLAADAARPVPGVPALFAGVVAPEEGLLLHGDDGFHRRLPAEWAERGLVLEDLSEALAARGPLVEKHLGRALSPRKGKFEALNNALWNRGVFVRVPKGLDVSLTLRGGYGFASADGQAVLPRTVIALEEGARAVYFDEYVSPPAGEGDAGGFQALSCGGVEIFLGPGAQLTYVNIQRWGRGVFHFLTQNALLERDARLTTLAVSLGGQTSRVNLGSELIGPGAASHLYGLVFGDGTQKFTHHTRQDHQVPHTQSDLLFKAALKDKARSVYTGMIRIAKEAQKADAYQTNRNLLLSPQAKAHTIPMLEILADDVRCSHGATVGSLDEDQRFYLMSRGLNRGEAERIIVEGFFEDVLQRVPGESVREKLRAAVEAKLGESAPEA